MNKYLLLASAALTVFALSVSPSFADSLEEVLGNDFTNTDGLLQSDHGSFANLAINSGGIDASVTEIGCNCGDDPVTGPTGTLHTIVTTTVGADGSEVAKVETYTDVHTNTTALITGVVATTAIGAINNGSIALNADNTKFGGSASLTASFADSVVDSTHASADADYFNISLTDVYYDETTLPDTAAYNIAFNNADINASVHLTGIAGATDTTAVGAVNTGIITAGIPGSVTLTNDLSN